MSFADTEDFIDRLLETYETCAEQGRSMEKIYIGVLDHEELMCVPVNPNYNLYDFQTEYMRNGTLMGLPVEVVPGIKGILIL